VSAEERAEYTRVIDEILQASDLETVTRKVIMRGLQEAVGKDLKEQKVCAPWNVRGDGPLIMRLGSHQGADHLALRRHLRRGRSDSTLSEARGQRAHTF